MRARSVLRTENIIVIGQRDVVRARKAWILTNSIYCVAMQRDVVRARKVRVLTNSIYCVAMQRDVVRARKARDRPGRLPL